jgi:hypothetical protein
VMNVLVCVLLASCLSEKEKMRIRKADDLLVSDPDATNHRMRRHCPWWQVLCTERDLWKVEATGGNA